MNDKKLSAAELSKIIGVNLNTFTVEHVTKWIDKTVEKYPEYKNDFNEVYDCIEIINNPTEKTRVARIITKYGKQLNLTQAFTKNFAGKLFLLGDSEIWYPLFIEVRRNSKVQSIVQALTYLENNAGDIINLLEKEDDIDYYRAFIINQPNRVNKEFVYKHANSLKLSSNQNKFKDCLKLLTFIEPSEDKLHLLVSLHKKTDNPYNRTEIVNQIEQHPENLLALSPIRKISLDSMFNVKKKLIYHGEIELDIGIINEHINKTQEQIKEIISTFMYRLSKEIKNVTGLNNYGGIDTVLRYQNEDPKKIDKISIVTEQLKNNITTLVEGLKYCNNQEETNKFMDQFFMSVKLEEKIQQQFSEKEYAIRPKLKI